MLMWSGTSTKNVSMSIFISWCSLRNETIYNSLVSINIILSLGIHILYWKHYNNMFQHTIAKGILVESTSFVRHMEWVTQGLNDIMIGIRRFCKKTKYVNNKYFVHEYLMSIVPDHSDMVFKIQWRTVHNIIKVMPWWM